MGYSGDRGHRLEHEVIYKPEVLGGLQIFKSFCN